MPQHALQPVLSGRAHIDGEFRFAVDHRQRGSGQQVIGQPHQDLTMETPSRPASVVGQHNHLPRQSRPLCVCVCVGSNGFSET